MNPYWSVVLELAKVVLPPVLSVGLGGYFLNRYFISKSNEAAFVDFLIERLNELQMDCLEYWCKEEPDLNSDRKMMIAQKIKGGTKALDSDLRQFFARYDKTSEHGDLLAVLLNSCTGGDFESKGVKPEPVRYLQVVNAISTIRSNLRKRKV